MQYQKAHFLISAAKAFQFPEDEGKEIAFVGRSNAGKSSALNWLTQQKNLARTSKTPGRTQLINFFNLDEEHRLVDLPGYGYAKVPTAVKRQWHALIDHYLGNRESLVGIVLLMDSRHPLMPFDEQMIEWTMTTEKPMHILLSKADKLAFNQQKKTWLDVQKKISCLDAPLSVQLFSTHKKIGLDELKKKLDEWLAS